MKHDDRSPTFRDQVSRLPVSLRALNALGRVRARLGIPAGPLSATRLLASARRRTGREDLGEGALLDPLRVLTGSFEHEAGLTEFGRLGVAALIRRALETRLRLVDLVRRRPEIRREDVSRPVFVVGFPRTGTTLLFNLLAQAEGTRPLLGWQAYRTMPPEGRRDRRIREHRRAIRRLRRVRPELWEIHEVDADGPEECLPLLLRGMATFAWLLYGQVPSFSDWLWSAPEEVHDAVYRFHRVQLQVLQWDRAGGRWLLKSPAHLNTLPSLLRAYPDACVVRTHRDLAKVLPSTCSLFRVIQSVFSDEVEPKSLGAHAIESARRSIERQLPALAPEAARRVLDVRYADLVADPVGTVERIHAHFGLEGGEELPARLATWMETHPRHQHGRHRYTLEQFGLDRAVVDELASPYRERFDVPREA